MFVQNNFDTDMLVNIIIIMVKELCNSECFL